MRTDNVETPTRVQLGARCYRRHVISDILEKALYKSPSAAFGNVMHSGSAEWWKSSDITLANAAILNEYKNREDAMNEKHSLELAFMLMRKYSENATLEGPFGASYDYNIVSLEQRYEVEIEGFKLNFQVDRLLGLGTERLLVVDLKTASRFDKKWRSQWEYDLQMKLYKVGMQKLFGLPTDIVIEGLEKTKGEIEYVVIPDHSDSVLDEAVEQFLYIARKDRDLLVGKDLPNFVETALVSTDFNYQDCYSYNVECPFARLCRANPEEREGILYGEYFDEPGDF